VFPFFILVALDDLVPRNFPAVLFRDALVIHGTQVALAKKTKLELLLPSRWIQGDGNVNQAETDAPFPNCTHTKLFRTARLIWASGERTRLACSLWLSRRNGSLQETVAARSEKSS